MSVKNLHHSFRIIPRIMLLSSAHSTSHFNFLCRCHAECSGLNSHRREIFTLIIHFVTPKVFYHMLDPFKVKSFQALRHHTLLSWSYNIKHAIKKGITLSPHFSIPSTILPILHWSNLTFSPVSRFHLTFNPRSSLLRRRKMKIFWWIEAQSWISS